MKKTFLTLSIAAALGGLTACGGGTSTGGNTGGTGISVTGVITKTAVAKADMATGATAGATTITVNNVAYTLDTSAQVSMDDGAGSAAALAEGQVVTLTDVDDHGDGTGTAGGVEFDDELEGYVVDIPGPLVADGNAASGFTGQLNVMGKVVNITVDTIFDGDGVKASIDQLAVQDIVEVSGYEDANGEISATRIELKDTDEEDVEVKGVVTALDTTNQTFQLGSLIVDYKNAALDDLPNGLSDGLYVEAKTDLAFTEAILSDGSGNYTMVATKVELEDDGDIDGDHSEGDDVEFEGFLSESGGEYSVNGVLLVLDATTRIDDGMTIEQLVGQRVIVEGIVDVDGKLLVEEIQRSGS